MEKKSTFLRGFDHKNTRFELSRNLITKACFQMKMRNINFCHTPAKGHVYEGQGVGGCF